MGVDITTWRCRVGVFTQNHGPGVMIINFSTLMKIIGCFTFVKMLLIMSGIEQNPGPAPPTINMIVTMSLGKPWELNLPISGDGPFIIKVMKDGIELTGNEHIEISYTAECVTIKVNKLAMDDSGTYRIDVSNNVGTVTCTFEMKVVAPPTIITKVEDQAVSQGEPLELNLPISGDGPFTIKVMKDSIELTGNDHIEMSCTADCLTIKVNKLTIEDSGSYRIDVTNGVGTDTCTFEMKVGGKYNFRYQCLLVEVGTKVLRKLFDCIVGNDFAQYLAANPTASNTLTSLMSGKNRIITADQKQLLPPINTKCVSSDFDITLLTCLLRNVCGLRDQNDTVWANPMPTDKSVEATITRLRKCRNNLFHSGTLLISKKSLNDKWTELSGILSELNKHCGKNSITNLPAVICEAKQMDFDEEKHTRFNKIVNMWCENDPDLREFKAKMTEMAIGQDAFKKVLDTVGEDIHDMKSEFIQFKAVLTLIAAKQEAAEAGQMLLYNGAQKCVSVGVEKTSIGVDDDVSRTMENMLSQIKEEDIDIVGVEKGSVILSLRCYSITALKNIYKYFADKQYNERLTELENTLSERLNCSVELNFSIVPETLYTALAQKEEATHRKSIVLTLQCRGAEGVRHAYKCLVNGSSTNAMNEVSEALSKAVGQDIELRTTIEYWNVRLLENDNFIFRYLYLLIHVGADVLRQVLNSIAGNDVVKFLTAHNNAIQSLITKKVINADQQKILQPVNGNPCLSNFDISLLACILRNICGLKSSKDPVWRNPATTDFSIEADITRLRMCRDDLMHSDRLHLPETDLEAQWKTLSTILTRLNAKAGITNLPSLINDALQMDLVEDLRKSFDETIKAWTEQDRLLDQRLANVQHEPTGVKRKLDDMASNTQQSKCQRIERIADQHFTFRYQYLLIEIGTKVLRELFDNIVGKDIMKYLNRNNNEYKQLQFIINRTNVLTDHQKQHLPPIDMKPNSANFDITLLTCLLRNICGLCNHKDLVWTSPAHTDLSLEADITRLRECRNLVHMQSVIIDEKDLQIKWQELTSILHGLNRTAKIPDLSSQINDAKCMDINYKAKQDYDEIMKSWIEMDKQNVQKDILEIYNDQCKTLPVSPLFENVDEKFLHIYQPPTMHSVEPTKNNPRQIDSYEDIFCKDSKFCKSIYITGDAGVGKTSLCRHMCLLWYMAKCGAAESNEISKKDVDYISKFDYVFCITLRETRRARVLDMIIERFFGCNEKYEHLIKSILRDKQCLVLLDGMDEWSPEFVEGRGNRIPERFYSGNCVYLTTCRPYRIESVRLSHKKDIDHQIQMTGISGRSSEHYIQKLVDYMNRQGSCNRKSSDFEKEVKKCGLNKQLSIPIITSHLVVLWYERPLTGMPSAVIYGNILEMLFKRAEKRKIQFPPSTPSTHQLPNSFTGLRHLNKYVSFIYNVCNLSFCSMFKQDENVRDQLESEPYCFSIQETDFLCKIGILSKNEVFGFCSEEKLKISFIHKTYLEFCAALFISSFDQSNSFNDVTKRWKCLDDVLPCENLLLLLAGFSYDGINQLFDNIYLQISDDLTLIRRNAIFHYEYYSYNAQMNSLQNIVANCFNELSRSKAIVLKMEDFIFDDDSDVDILRQLLLLNSKYVKSIHSVKGKYYPEFDQIHCLQYLHVRVSSDNIVKFTQFMLQNESTLHTVCIDGGYTLIPELPVRSLHHLSSLSLYLVKIQHNSLHYLVKFLSDNVLIENIKLSCVSCDEHQRDDSDCTLTLNIPQHTKLTSLYLEDVNILCNNVNNSSLQSVTLWPLSERIVRLCYSDLFKCFKDSQLEHLEINGFPGYMLDSYKLDYKTMKTLTSTVKSLPCLKSLRLDDMKLPDDVLLQLHPQVTQVEIDLEYVTMSRQWFHCFVESCVNISEIKVVLVCCQITSVDGETHSVLSREESVKYMSEHLESISTINITYKGDTWLHFETSSCQ